MGVTDMVGRGVTAWVEVALGDGMGDGVTGEVSLQANKNIQIPRKILALKNRLI